MYGLDLAALATSETLNGIAALAAFALLRLLGMALPRALARAVRRIRDIGMLPSGATRHASPTKSKAPALNHLQLARTPARRSRWASRPRQRQLQHLVNGPHEMELEVVAQMLGNLIDILLVELGSDHRLDPVALRGECLLFQPTDR